MGINVSPAWLMAAILAAGLGHQARAQSASSPTRADVKAQTVRAQKEHRLLPAGEAAAQTPAPTTRSTTTRAQRKQETAQARAAGELLPAGDAASLKRDKQARSLMANKTRAQRKAETLKAAKDNELVPAGEGSGVRSR